MVNIEASTKANPEAVAFRTEGTSSRELATMVKSDGTWRIDHVPEGLRTLKVIEPNGATTTLTVTACASDTPVDVSIRPVP